MDNHEIPPATSRSLGRPSRTVGSQLSRLPLKVVVENRWQPAPLAPTPARETNAVRLNKLRRGARRSADRTPSRLSQSHRCLVPGPPPTNLASTQVPARTPRNSQPIFLDRKNQLFLMKGVIIP
jgi:hypothetical protein